MRFIKNPNSDGRLTRISATTPQSAAGSDGTSSLPSLGFVLLAHTEAEGRYRAPHDHGESWVIYGVLQGVMEMATDASGRSSNCPAYGIGNNPSVVTKLSYGFGGNCEWPNKGHEIIDNLIADLNAACKTAAAVRPGGLLCPRTSSRRSR